MTGAAGTSPQSGRSEGRSWILFGGAVASLVVGVSLATAFPLLHGYAATESPVGFVATYPFRMWGWFVPEAIHDWNRPLLRLIGPPYVAIYAALQPRLGEGVPAFLTDSALLGLALATVVANVQNLRATAGFRAAIVNAAAPGIRIAYWVAAGPGLLLLLAGSSPPILAALAAYLGVLGVVAALRGRSGSASPPIERRADADGRPESEHRGPKDQGAPAPP